MAPGTHCLCMHQYLHQLNTTQLQVHQHGYMVHTDDVRNSTSIYVLATLNPSSQDYQTTNQTENFLMHKIDVHWG